MTNDDLAKNYGIDTTHEWIHQRTGIEERRYAEEGVGSAEMGYYAAKKALEIVPVGTVDEVLARALTRVPVAIEWVEPEIENVPPWNSSGFSLRSRARVARSAISALICARPLVSAAQMIGVMRPCGIATATAMSAW